VLYSVRSERMLMEQLQYNTLFRWFVGPNMDDEVWNATTFSKNRDRIRSGSPWVATKLTTPETLSLICVPAK
jgi:transposase